MQSYRTFWNPNCVIAVHVTDSVTVEQFVCCIVLLNLEFPSVETKRLVWKMLYFEIFSLELTCYLFLQSTYHLCFHFQPLHMESIYIVHFLPETLLSTPTFRCFFSVTSHGIFYIIH